jgi:hypothetical protein
MPSKGLEHDKLGSLFMSRRSTRSPCQAVLCAGGTDAQPQLSRSKLETISAGDRKQSMARSTLSATAAPSSQR